MSRATKMIVTFVIVILGRLFQLFFKNKIKNMSKILISNGRKKNMKISPWVVELRFYSILKCK